MAPPESVLTERPFDALPGSKVATTEVKPVKEAYTTKATVQYALPPEDSEGYYNYVRLEPPEGKPPSNTKTEEHVVTVTDIRTTGEQFTLEKNGFAFHKVNVPEINWEDPEDVNAKYYPVIEELLRKGTGATRAHVFDHVTRRGKIDNSPGALQKAFAKQAAPSPSDAPRPRPGPVGRAHVDFSAKSGIERLNIVLPEEAEKLRKTPFAIVQVWRPLKGPVKSSPLGLIDASTVERTDYVKNALIYEDRVGQTYAVKHNPKHKWYFAEGIQTDEAYLFICYDSRTDRARFTPHTGIQDHSVDPEAPPRESVEIRAYVFWEDLPQQPYAPPEL